MALGSILTVLGRHIPASAVRAIGRRTDRAPFAWIEARTRSTLAGDQTIVRGAGSGLRFNNGGGRPGYVLGTWEPRVQSVFASALGRGQVVCDIGSASGFYAVIAARAVGSTGLVVAFEPLPESVARLRHNISLNAFTNVTVLPLAVGDTVGTATLVPGRAEGQARLAASLSAGEAAASLEVEVMTIDRLVDEGVIPVPDIIKLDVEGAEIAVLIGARQTLALRKPTLLIECHDCWTELELLLKEHGYRYRFVEARCDPVSPEPFHVFASA